MKKFSSPLIFGNTTLELEWNPVTYTVESLFRGKSGKVDLWETGVKDIFVANSIVYSGEGQGYIDFKAFQDRTNLIQKGLPIS